MRLSRRQFTKEFKLARMVGLVRLSRASFYRGGTAVQGTYKSSVESANQLKNLTDMGLGSTVPSIYGNR
jgi:uncharacterized protein (UPF0333 family)